MGILINIGRVVMTRVHVAKIPNLVADVFQTMLVYRDSSSEIFCKCCALLQILTAETIMKDQLLTSNSKKKLNDYMTIVSKKKKLKEENQKRRSINVLPPAPSSSRKPLRPTNLNNTVTKSSNLNSTVTKPSLNTTVTIK